MVVESALMKKSHRNDGILKIKLYPIVQALAPYLPAGCCAVVELVSRALSMVIILLYNYSVLSRESQEELLPKFEYKNW